MTQLPPTPPTAGPIAPGSPVQPHRGSVILVLGILGLVVCPICGIIAWVMGNTDLGVMRTGRMDPAGQGLTKAGKICGMIAVFLCAGGALLWVVIVVLAMAAGVAGVESTM